MTDISEPLPDDVEIPIPVRDEPDGVPYVETNPDVLASADEGPTTIPSPAMPPRTTDPNPDD